ncbi:MAG: class I mannose-6-phosphate isomerase [Pedobacter sp.]|nr:class I mannose-6-phosphate isomerase [Pedobacter sp.]
MTDPILDTSWRASSQPLIPVKLSNETVNRITYNHLPVHKLGGGKIFEGYDSLVEWIIAQKTVIIDGYAGVFFDAIQQQIDSRLSDKGISLKWHCTADYLKAEEEVELLVEPYLGTKESVWGTKADLKLSDFFSKQLVAIQQDPDCQINIVIGLGASLSGWDAPIVYFDIPKNEIQYRMRAGSVNNIGSSEAQAATSLYKRFYFVDWVVADLHRKEILSNIEIVADGQWQQNVTWMFKEYLEAGLAEMARTVFRVRPWFEKGSWGGQWMKEHVKGLNNEEVNYAWSFELITPENGLILESDNFLLEVSFDFLMLLQYKAIIGKHATLFGPYFPIRFDFLDTFNGGNLSIQCHPSREYISNNFGEHITQDETYYILDSKPGSKVYLGFQEDIDPKEFRKVLEASEANNEKIELERFVQAFPSNKHDLFLIPNGTVHSSGVNNMVLEISATPYIFTFKMYDWLSLDLNGNPRPINIDHAFNNLNFERKGDVVTSELIAHPNILAKGEDWELIHLPTHQEHFYDVHRIEFQTNIEVDTEDSCQVLMLVEGDYIELEIEGKFSGTFAYAETFVIPAAAKHYKLINGGDKIAKVIKAFIKEETKL